jgi:hypothetical protein
MGVGILRLVVTRDDDAALLLGTAMKRTVRQISKAVKAEAVRQPKGWPAGYVKSFSGLPDDFARPPQGRLAEKNRPR